MDTAGRVRQGGLGRLHCPRVGRSERQEQKEFSVVVIGASAYLLLCPHKLMCESNNHGWAA